MSPDTTIIILTLALLSGITTVIGLVLAYYFKGSQKTIAIGIGFSAGIMILISFFELIPESLKKIEPIETLIAVLGGALIIALINFFIPHEHLIKEKGIISVRLYRVAFLAATGLILHDFPEGFALANSYIVSPSLGLFIAIAIALHNIPEEFAMAIPFIAVGKKLKFLLKLAVISALAEPAGALIGLLAVNISSAIAPICLSAAAGAMIYISAHELLPLAKIYRHASLFIVGIVISGGVYLGLNYLIPE